MDIFDGVRYFYYLNNVIFTQYINLAQNRKTHRVYVNKFTVPL